MEALMKLWPFKKKSFELADGRWVYMTGRRINVPRLSGFLTAARVSEAVYACLAKIQEAAKTVPWYVYRRAGEDVVEVPAGPLVNFLRRPGKRIFWDEFVERYLAHLCLTGNAYIRILMPEGRTRVEVQFLRPDLMSPHRTSDDRIVYEYRGSVKLSEDEVIHIKLSNPEEDDEDHLVGLSPLASVVRSVDTASLAQEWILRLLEKGAQPPIALSSEHPLTQEQREFLKEQLTQEFLGPENADKPLILEMMKPQKIGFSPREIEFDPMMKAAQRRIANIYGVPTELLGDIEQKTYSNAKEAMRALYHWAVLPKLEKLKNALNLKLVSVFDPSGAVYMDYDISGVEALADDLDALWERVGRAVDRGLIDRNEGRQELGWGKRPEPAAGRITVGANTIPLDLIVGGDSEEA